MTKIICPEYLLSKPSWDLTYDHVKRAYSVGYSDGMEARKTTDPLDGFSNLTQAIHDGTRIDWEKLDGLEAKCVHPEMGTLTKKLVRNHHWDIDEVSAWHERHDHLWGAILNRAWPGTGGWSLWVEGEIPVKNRTADELEPGTCIRGYYYKHNPDDCEPMTVVLLREGKFVSYITTNDIFPASEVNVVEEYGVGVLFNDKQE